jgi:CDP-diacylglycerol--glycerol-3-phosphate 3-phosphatidyltransferase
MINLPNLLSALRIALVPVLLVLAWEGHPRLFLATLAVSLSTDLLDGFAARRLRQCTPLGTKLDSWGDLLTYTASVPAIFLLWPEQMRSEWGFVTLAIVALAVPTLYGVLKFGRITSYHTWAAKLSAVLVGPGVLLLLGLGEPALFRVAVVVTALSAIEEMAITTRLSSRRQNIPSYWHLCNEAVEAPTEAG